MVVGFISSRLLSSCVVNGGALLEWVDTVGSEDES